MYLTKKQKEIYDLRVIHQLRWLSIAKRLQVSHQAIYKVKKILEKKGYLYKGLPNYEKVAKGGGVLPQNATSTPSKQIRVHGQQFQIKILNKSENYSKYQKNSNQIYLQDATILLYPESIAIFLKKSFTSDTILNSLEFSSIYLTKTLHLLESRLNIKLLKNGYQNITQCKCHVAEIENEIAIRCNINHQKIKIRTNEDNKVWLLVDNSFNLHELETIHKDTSIPDMETLHNFFNDLRDNPNLPLISKLNETQNLHTGSISGIIKILSNYGLYSPNNSNPPKNETPADYFG